MKIIATLMAVTALAVAPGPAPAQDGRDLARISAYINALDTAEGDFVQIAPNGETSDGRFYISRPGRIRFEYTPPNPALVVSDGVWVVVYDMRNCSKQTAPLSATPLELLLRDDAVERERRLLERSGRLLHGLSTLPKVHVHTPVDDARRAGIVCFRVDGVAPQAIHKALIEAGIYSAIRGPSLRLSPHFYTPHAQLDRALEVLADALQTL